MFVYLITNLINGKRYVGQTSRTLKQRWSSHCASNNCSALNFAIKKYGFESFNMEPIIEVESKDLADEFEKEYIKLYCSKSPNGYNLTDGGEGLFNPSEETRSKMALRMTGTKQSKYTKQKRSRALKGHPVSDSTKKSISLALLGNNNGRRENLSEEVLKGKQKIGRENGKKNGPLTCHIRWHVGRGIFNIDCKFCKEILNQGQRIGDGNKKPI